MIDTQKVKEYAAREAAALRAEATAEERSKLDFSRLNTRHMYFCIYGQIADGCFSERAEELIGKCCPQFYASIYLDSELDNRPIHTSDRMREDWQTISRQFSAIELYITLPDARNAEPIAYLRGETDSLEL